MRPARARRASPSRLRVWLAVAALGCAKATGQTFLTCDPASVQLRPGESTCIIVITSPPTAGVVIAAGFDPALVSVDASATTGTGGTAVFTVGHAATALSGTPVRFSSSGFISCTTTVVCDLPALRLHGIAGSAPGTLALRLSTATPVTAGTIGAILMSPGPGPLPLGALNPGDPRQLAVGLGGLTILPGHAGLFAPPGFTEFTAVSFAVPALAGPGVLFAQGLSIDPTATPRYNRISQPQPIYVAPAQSFQPLSASMTLARSFFPVMLDDRERVVIAGGGQGGILAQIATDQVEVYDPVTGGFAAHPVPLNVARSLHTATALPNGKWLLVGGVDVQNDPTASAELYDPSTGLFTPVGSMSEARMGHAATLLANGDVLVSGGLSVVNANPATTIQSALDTTEVFRLDGSGCGGSFVPGPRMTRGRAGHGVIELADGRLLIAGGVGPSSFLGLPIPAIWTQTEFYDGSGFRGGPSMPNARAIFPITQIGTSPDRYLAAGGLNSALGLGAPTDAADVYTAQPGGNGSWARAGNMSQPSGMQAAVRQGNEVVHFGGLQGALTGPTALAVTEIYDIATGSWRNGPTMPTERGAYGSYTDAYGVIHLLGGAAGPGQNPAVVASAVRYFR